MEIILYSTGCPKCKVLKKKLADKNIEYLEIGDTAYMAALGIDAVPVLSVGGKPLSFQEAVEWVNEREEQNT